MPSPGTVSFLLPKDALGTLTWATDPWATPTTLAIVTTAATTLSPWPKWPADAAGGAIAAKVSVIAGQRYLLLTTYYLLTTTYYVLLTT